MTFYSPLIFDQALDPVSWKERLSEPLRDKIKDKIKEKDKEREKKKHKVMSEIKKENGDVKILLKSKLYWVNVFYIVYYPVYLLAKLLK